VQNWKERKSVVIKKLQVEVQHRRTYNNDAKVNLFTKRGEGKMGTSKKGDKRELVRWGERDETTTHFEVEKKKNL